jgi:hypothetical protein
MATDFHGRMSDAPFATGDDLFLQMWLNTAVQAYDNR